MTPIDRKRPAADPPARAPRHPCFWAVLDGECLNLVFVSASLHAFLGPDRAAAVLGGSLFDHIHPEEAARARRDLVDTFVSKSLVGSSIRRLDLEKPGGGGFQQIFRRASESQIVGHARPQSQIHESLERKLSLPIIPDIAKLRTNACRNPPSPTVQQPMPKRLRTILEDSIGCFAPPSSASTTTTTSAACGPCPPIDAPLAPGSSADGPPDCCDSYLIAKIGLYLVSPRLLIMVCHYEGPASESLFSGYTPAGPAPQRDSALLSSASASASASSSPSLPPSSSSSSPPPPPPPCADRCDCVSGAPAMADAERIHHLLSHIHRLDAHPMRRGAISPGPRDAARQRGARNGNSSSSSSSNAGCSAGLASRHVQIYSIGTERLLCAFPDGGYQRVYGRSPANAAAGSAGLRGLWEHSRDKRAEAHAMSLLQGPPVPDTAPIHLELQVRPSGAGAPVDVQTIFFRWSTLLFVCQQMRGDSPPEPVLPGDDAGFLNYNFSMPPRQQPQLQAQPGEDPASSGARPDRHIARPGAIAGGRGMVRNSSPIGHFAVPEPRPFSLSRAPASVAANLPPRILLPPPPPHQQQQPPPPADGGPPRRQSSHTLPPAKVFEERRFSYPNQALYSERRPPPLPIPPQQHQQQQQQQRQQHHHPLPHQQLPLQQHTPASGALSAAMTPGGAGSNQSTASPGGRLADARRRASAGVAGRGSATLAGKEPPSQPTPVSPASAGIVQRTVASPSPAPPHSANPGPIQVLVYPPSDAASAAAAAASMWRWHHTQPQPQPQPLPQTLPPTPTGSGGSHAYPHGHPQPAPRLPPALALGRTVHSPHPHHLTHSAVYEQHRPPAGAAMSPISAGLTPAARGDREKKTCKSCGTDSSPEWRKGPTGHKT
ncbi:hypothetical protein H4R18_002908 [Coemansia javaensis]|uniref:GATA-type domain-containing protein n=1 Tax=Coemansia javaensis TaxID=2761396 RepID=A0A9W8H8G3_9FUNG|nr:hypothetical protein H4R18_002908 [Coemansia javaensis]